MKKNVTKSMVFFLLCLGLLSGPPNKVRTESETLCGFVFKYWEDVSGCGEFVPMESCEGWVYYLDEPPSSFMGRYVMLVNPEWYFIRCEGGDEIPVIVGWESAHLIGSCAECGRESCEEWLHIKCNVGGYDLYIDGDYVFTEDGDGDSGVALPPGTYTVKLKKEGCDTVTETVRIECGHETTLRVTMNCNEDCDNGRDDDGDGKTDCNDSDCRNDPDCDPCRNVNCPDTRCYGCELWKITCDNGECVKDYLVEKDSEECGCGEDPCKEDSDNDGVNNCEDRCPNTPGWMSQVLQVDSEGCLYCLDKESRCAASVIILTAIPSMGIENIILDSCEIIARLADGDVEGAKKEVPALLRDILLMAAKILVGFISIPLEIVGDVLDALQTILTCLPALSSSEMEAVYDESIQMMADENIDVLSLYVGSPVTAKVIDDRGNTLTESTRGIPSSYMFTIGNDKVGLIVNPAGEYRIEVQGTESGTYDLRIIHTKGGEITYDKEYSNVQTSRGEVDTYKATTYNVETQDRKEEASLFYSLPLTIIGVLMGLYVGKRRREGE